MDSRFISGFGDWFIITAFILCHLWFSALSFFISFSRSLLDADTFSRSAPGKSWSVVMTSSCCVAWQVHSGQWLCLCQMSYILSSYRKRHWVLSVSHNAMRLTIQRDEPSTLPYYNLRCFYRKVHQFKYLKMCSERNASISFWTAIVSIAQRYKIECS